MFSLKNGRKELVAAKEVQDAGSLIKEQRQEAEFQVTACF
jgi:hypothetical protein